MICSAVCLEVLSENGDLVTVYKTVMPEIEAKTRLAAAKNDLGAYPEFKFSEQQGDVDISVTNEKFGDQFDEDFL